MKFHLSPTLHDGGVAIHVILELDRGARMRWTAAGLDPSGPVTAPWIPIGLVEEDSQPEPLIYLDFDQAAQLATRLAEMAADFAGIVLKDIGDAAAVLAFLAKYKRVELER